MKETFNQGIEQGMEEKTISIIKEIEKSIS